MATAKKATAKKATAKKATAKKATAKKATAKKATAKKATAKKATAKKATAKKATARSAAASKENLLVASKLREAIRTRDIRMAGDLVDALNEEVHSLIDRAVARAKGNNRGTVRPGDL